MDYLVSSVAAIQKAIFAVKTTAATHVLRLAANQSICFQSLHLPAGRKTVPLANGDMFTNKHSASFFFCEMLRAVNVHYEIGLAIEVVLILVGNLWVSHSR